MDNSSLTYKKGFTLIEMLVVITIIGVVSAIVVTSQKSFERSVVLTNTAYDIALSVREAQAFGFSGKSATNVSTDIGNYAYGIDFDMSKPMIYTLFADTKSVSQTQKCHKIEKITGSPNQKIGDCYFSGGDTVVKKSGIDNSVAISKICVTSATVICKKKGQLDISFTRPNSVYVKLSTSSGTYNGNTACIEVSRFGSSRYILMKGYGSSIPYVPGTISISNTLVAPYCGSN